MLYDIIQKCIESAVAELNNIELIREKGRTGRMALLLIVVAVWITSEILYFTTKLVPNLILIDLITILFLAEYMMLSTLANSQYDIPMTYLVSFAVNTTLLYLFVAVTGGTKSIFLILPLLYLFLVFIIDSLLPVLISFGVSIIGVILLDASNSSSFSMLLMIISFIFVTIIGVYFQFYDYKKKFERALRARNNPNSGTNDRLPDYSVIEKMKQTLTKKEYEIVYYVIKGLSTEDIAAKLFVEETTIKFHLKNIFKKLAITSKVDLISLFIPSGMLDRFESSLSEVQRSAEDKDNLPKSIG